MTSKYIKPGLQVDWETENHIIARHTVIMSLPITQDNKNFWCMIAGHDMPVPISELMPCTCFNSKGLWMSPEVCPVTVNQNPNNMEEQKNAAAEAHGEEQHEKMQVKDETTKQENNGQDAGAQEEVSDASGDSSAESDDSNKSSEVEKESANS